MEWVVLGVECPGGLHARVAARVARAVREAHGESEAGSGVIARYGARLADASSITELLALEAPAGAALQFMAEPLDAQLLGRLREALRGDGSPEVGSAPVRSACAPGSYCGIGVSPGVAVGRIWQSERRAGGIVGRTAAGTNVESGRLRRALNAVRGELSALAAGRSQDAGVVRGVLLAEQEMLQDERLWRGAEERLQAEPVTAETAVAGLRQGLADCKRGQGAELIEDMLARVMEALEGAEDLPEAAPHAGGVVWLDESVRPSRVVGGPGRGLVAWLGVRGGYTSHAAVLCRAQRVPMVVGLPREVLSELRSGDLVRVDGASGRVTREGGGGS